MSAYKVIFVNNNILSITATDNEYFFEGDTFYYEYGGYLIFAIFKTDTKSAALDKARKLIASKRKV